MTRLYTRTDLELAMTQILAVTIDSAEHGLVEGVIDAIYNNGDIEVATDAGELRMDPSECKIFVEA